MVFLKVFVEKVDFEKNQQKTKKLGGNEYLLLTLKAAFHQGKSTFLLAMISFLKME